MYRTQTKGPQPFCLFRSRPLTVLFTCIKRPKKLRKLNLKAKPFPGGLEGIYEVMYIVHPTRTKNFVEDYTGTNGKSGSSPNRLLIFIFYSFKVGSKAGSRLKGWLWRNLPSIQNIAVKHGVFTSKLQQRLAQYYWCRFTFIVSLIS